MTAALLENLDFSFRSLAALTAVAVPLYAGWVRGRRYALFAGIVLWVSLPGAVISHIRLTALFPEWTLPWLHAAFGYCMAAAALHLSHLVRARLRSWPFRWLVSLPGQTFIAAGFMAGLWLLALLPLRAALSVLGLDGVLQALRVLDLVPFAVAGGAIVTSLRLAAETVRLRLGDDGPDVVTRLPVERHRRRTPPPLAERPLRIVQIADPHLGPWKSVTALRRSIEALLARDPDLVLLTGDYLTMEGSGTPGALAEALTPLRSRAAQSYAIFGNHDHESVEEVRGALDQHGVRLLVDAEAVAETPVGPVQIIGSNWVQRDRRSHLVNLLRRYPRRKDHLRLLLLHDPSGFRHIPPGEVDLTLSGHTHGGQVGLVSLGLDWTVLSGSRWPDHGLFALGSNRLYVHRGTGFYGFPLRVGVPGEASMLELTGLPAGRSSTASAADAATR
ncbi:MAG: metallophosphoesterase [Acidobacteriota bacterium]